MRCDKIRELLATDYIDGELDSKAMGLVEAHLASCASCKAFENAVRAAAVGPFKGASHVEPPVRIWKRIEEAIAPAPRPAGALEGLRERLEALFALPRARLAVAAVAMVVFVVALIGYQRYSEERALSLYIEEGASYLSQLSNGTNGANDVSDPYEVGNFYQGTSV